MEKLYQNNLAKATTDLGFLEVLNGNAESNVVYLEREVTLDDGTVVNVEGMTPASLKTALNNAVDSEDQEITYQTPGEDFVENGEVLIKGVVQAYNDSVESQEDVKPEPEPEPEPES